MSAGRPAARHLPKPWSQQRPKGQRLQAGGRHATVRAFQVEEHSEGQGPQANGQRDTFPLTVWPRSPPAINFCRRLDRTTPSVKLTAQSHCLQPARQRDTCPALVAPTGKGRCLQAAWQRDTFPTRVEVAPKGQCLQATRQRDIFQARSAGLRDTFPLMSSGGWAAWHHPSSGLRSTPAVNVCRRLAGATSSVELTAKGRRPQFFFPPSST